MVSSTIVAATDLYQSTLQGSRICRDSAGIYHVVYAELTGAVYYIRHKSSPDEGATWSAVHTVFNNGASALRDPSICVDGSDNLHVVYGKLDGGQLDCIYQSSNDGGSTWSGETLLWDGSVLASSCYGHSIILDTAGTIHVTTTYSQGGFYQVVHKNYPVGGPWSGEIVVNTDAAHQSEPNLAVKSDNTLICVWTGNVGGINQVRYATWTGGPAWSATTNLTATADHKQETTVAYDSNDVRWIAYRSLGGGAINRIYTLNDGGLTNVSTPNDKNRYRPQIQFDSNDNAHLLCMNASDTDSEYFLYTAGTNSWGGAVVIGNGAAWDQGLNVSGIYARYPASVGVPISGYSATWTPAGASPQDLLYDGDATWPAGPGGGARHPAYRKPLHVTPLTGRRPFGPEY